MSYNFKDFDTQFPDDAACLDFVFRARYANHVCECGHKGCFHRRAKRRAYECAWCGAQIYPTAGTIFHKSETSLKSWFFAIFLFAKSKNGVAAKELERQLGVTYKTAHRMGHQIRRLMAGGGNMLTGVVEADETYIGGRRAGLRGRGTLGKTPVIGAVERRGEVRATVVTNVTAANAIGHIRQNVETTAQVVTDEFPVYNYTAKFGFKHVRVNHGAGEYVVGRVHTNTIEGFWSQLKRSLDGTHHSVSRKYLQNYVNEFAWRYNRRFDGEMFSSLVFRTGLKDSTPAKASAETSI
jgi:transposase-like protein/ribosomal protein L24E